MRQIGNFYATEFSKNIPHHHCIQNISLYKYRQSEKMGEADTTQNKPLLYKNIISKEVSVPLHIFVSFFREKIFGISNPNAPNPLFFLQRQPLFLVPVLSLFW